jgi:hypothetical protein
MRWTDSLYAHEVSFSDVAQDRYQNKWKVDEAFRWRLKRNETINLAEAYFTSKQKGEDYEQEEDYDQEEDSDGSFDEFLTKRVNALMKRGY